eukprot:354463-Chlamydomonas_euryale.AAC.11
MGWSTGSCVCTAQGQPDLRRCWARAWLLGAGTAWPSGMLGAGMAAGRVLVCYANAWLLGSGTAADLRHGCWA